MSPPAMVRLVSVGLSIVLVLLGLVFIGLSRNSVGVTLLSVGAVVLICVVIDWYNSGNTSHHPPPPPHRQRQPQELTGGPPRMRNQQQSAPRTSNGIPSNSQDQAPSLNPRPNPVGEAFNKGKTTFTLKELEEATDSFSSTNIVGRGGFGFVYKGKLPGGREVAIKQLKVGSGQGQREFKAEVEAITLVHHRHLISLVGYCISRTAGTDEISLALVYEYVPKGSLESKLHGTGEPLKWATRMKIAIGCAKGLSYLHEDCKPTIIHRDIKSANILLDELFEPKVADFGLARFLPDTDTHVSTQPSGTFGYLAPEVASDKQVTTKSDVYSFGIVLLELITGRKPIDQSQEQHQHILRWAIPSLTQALESDNFDSVADPRLHKEYNPNEMNRMVACASACVQDSAKHRPRMSKILRTLEGDLPVDELNKAAQPELGTIPESNKRSDNRDDQRKFRKMASETTKASTSKAPY